MSVRLRAERSMSLEWRARSSSLAWSNPLAWWWGLLTLVSTANIAVWFSLYRQLHEPPTGSLGSTSGIDIMLLLCAAYVFGCAFRSFLPRADVQRICLFDTWLSSVVVGRSVATVAEICFAAQWSIILHQLGATTGADTTLTAAWVIVPLILIAECFSWHAVLTTNYLGNAIENSIWAASFFVVEIAWMSLYFSTAVWASLALCVFYSLADHLPRYRTEVTVASRCCGTIASASWVGADGVASTSHREHG